MTHQTIASPAVSYGFTVEALRIGMLVEKIEPTMSTPIQTITVPGAAPALGHYSPGVRAGNLLFVSGQVAVLPDGTSVAHQDFASQSRQCLANLRAVVEAGGSSLDRVVRLTVYLAQSDGWPIFNEVCAQFFGAHKPARAVIPVGDFHGGFLVEVDSIAVVDA